MRLRFTEINNPKCVVRLGYGGMTAAVYLYPCAERKSERVFIGF